MLRICSYFFIYVIVITPAFAVEVTPMVVTFSPDSRSSNASSLVHNQLPRDIAFDIQIYEIDFSQGTPKLISLDDSPLWVFPPSLFLQPGQSQQLQFRWLDKKLPSTDKSYQVSLIEQPIRNQSINKQSQLTMLLNVNLIVHLDQPRLVPKLTIKEPHVEDGFIITKVLNEGKGAGRLSDYEIKIIKNKTLSDRILKDQLKANGYDVFFAPNSTSVIKVPIPQSLQKGSLNHLRLVLAR
ncbi:hypothetical protein [Pseudoalteromonas sp. SWN166]|uniref:hypothetical protein n=1 Tax=Pseudoalteromonas sp. SWN166 TaxID=2792061 RepID=UPI0018CC7C69|nr:hypothetical protein [Pseudoalteromonas sp. SWN166]MBH0037745.1 hypothetical protein [Pseudoalteromonas sp. SWN166]